MHEPRVADPASPAVLLPPMFMVVVVVRAGAATHRDPAVVDAEEVAIEMVVAVTKILLAVELPMTPLFCRVRLPPLTVRPLPLTVRAPATVTAPLNLEVPRTPRVVDGEAVPMPTTSSLAFTTRVVVSVTRPPRKVEEAVADVVLIEKCVVPDPFWTKKAVVEEMSNRAPSVL